VFAGFTYCPKLCPTTLATLKQTKALLGPSAAKGLTRLFLSVDPDRDKPKRLADYVHHFDPDFKGVTGGEDELKKLLAGLGLVYLKQQADGGGQAEIDHSAHIAIIDPAGRHAGYLTPPFTAEGLAADIGILLGLAASQ